MDRRHNPQHTEFGDRLILLFTIGIIALFAFAGAVGLFNPPQQSCTQPLEVRYEPPETSDVND